MLRSDLCGVASILCAVITFLPICGCSSPPAEHDQMAVLPTVRNAIIRTIPRLSEEDRNVIKQQAPQIGRYQMAMYWTEYHWLWSMPDGSHIQVTYKGRSAEAVTQKDAKVQIVQEWYEVNSVK